MSFTIAISPSSFSETNDLPMKILNDTGAIIKENSYKRRLTEDEIISHLKYADGLIAGLEPLNRKVLESAKQLKALARVGIGMDNVDLQAAKELGIKISNTPDAPSVAVAELTVSALLSIQRNLIQMNSDMHVKKWNKIIAPGLHNKIVLIIGFGRIGRKVYEYLQPFGVEILIHDPLLNKLEQHKTHNLVSLEEGLSRADIISLHASGSDVILKSETFAMMKKGVTLLNSARGELVDELSLLSALDEGKVFGVWFDAFSNEPYNGKLCNYPQVLLTPHVSTYTESCRLDMETQAVKNLLRDLNIT
jgi:D-3-phosphoglycerate dehydrogenase / 2-oxoglutarate reductase